MAYRTLDLTLNSAQNLRKVGVMTPMQVYAIVSLTNNPLSTQTTPLDYLNGRNPIWNTTMRLNVPVQDNTPAFVHILLCAKGLGLLGGDKDVGQVLIPLKDLLNVDTTSPRFVSYQVYKTVSGKPKGVIYVTYKFVEQFTDGPSSKVASSSNLEEPVMAYPVVYEQGYGYNGYGYCYDEPRKMRRRRMGRRMGPGAGIIGGLILGSLIF